MRVMLSSLLSLAILIGLSLTAEAIPFNANANGNAYGQTNGNGPNGNALGLTNGNGPNGNAYGLTGGNGNGNAYGLLGANGGSGGNGVYSTSTVGAVPIPGTLLLLGVGFASLVGWQLWEMRRKLKEPFQLSIE